MNNKPLTYTVQQVGEMVGISKQLVRKWEDRYQIIAPHRLSNGYRAYTLEDVDILCRVKQLTDRGHSPKQAVEIVKSAPTNYTAVTNYSVLTHPSTASTGSVSEAEKTFPNRFVEQLVVCGANGDDVGIVRILKQAQMSLGVDRLLDEVVTPFLHQVGDYWCDAVWGEFQEAMSSLAVRDFLVNLRRTVHVSPDAPLILGSCLPGERHEIPMHILLIKCMLLGYQTLMLGPSPAPSSIQAAVNLKNPQIVLLTASTTVPFDQHLTEILALNQFAVVNPHIRFYVGGAGAALNSTACSAIQLIHDLSGIIQQQHI